MKHDTMGFLCLTLNRGEAIKIGENIYVQVIAKGSKIRLLVAAPKDVRISRGAEVTPAGHIVIEDKNEKVQKLD